MLTVNSVNERSNARYDRSHRFHLIGYISLSRLLTYCTVFYTRIPVSWSMRHTYVSKLNATIPFLFYFRSPRYILVIFSLIHFLSFPCLYHVLLPSFSAAAPRFLPQPITDTSRSVPITIYRDVE